MSAPLPGGFHVEESDVHMAWLVMLDNEVMRILLKKHFTRAQAEEEARRMAAPLVGCEEPKRWKGDAPTLSKSEGRTSDPTIKHTFDAEDYIVEQQARKLIGKGRKKGKRRRR